MPLQWHILHRMRIISGKFARRQLVKVRGEIRPTGARLRTSLFDSFGERVVGSHWLDAFAGTGVVGLEALSRGASQVVFNDRDGQALKTLRRNLQACGAVEACGAEQGYRIFERDVFVLLRKLKPERPFDFVFLDPPYRFGRHEKLLEKLSVSELVVPGSYVILEAFKKTDPATPARLSPDRRIRAGDDVLNLYSVQDAPP